MNKLNNKKILSLLFIVLIGMSIISGVFLKRDNYKLVFINMYNINNDKITSNISEFNKKDINNFNKEFSENNEGIKIYPTSAKKLSYIMKIDTKHDYDNLTEKYSDFIKQKDLSISIVDFYDRNDYGEPKNIVWIISNVIAMCIFIFSYIYAFKQIPDEKKNIIYMISALIIGGISSALGYGITTSIIFVFIGLFFNLYYKKDNKFLAYIVLAGIAFRLIGIFVMTMYNIITTGNVISYFQPDEMFYYYTSSEIYLFLAAGKWPNFMAITGIKQYAYNAIVAFIELLNKDVLLTSKLLNCLVSTIFIVVVYNFIMRLMNNKRIAKITAILIAFIPSFVLFSSFLLRDIIISVLMFLILDEIVIVYDDHKRWKKSMIKIFVGIGILWYLRNYTTLMIVGLGLLYIILRFLEKKNKNILVYTILLCILLIPFGMITSRIYGFNVVSSIINYIKGLGIVEYLTGLVCSFMNLDFITNMAGTNYTVKTLILRIFYPDTLFLILTAPFYVLGIKSFYKKNKSFTIITILMAIGFITIYKFEYGGWFIRTQLQIFAYQYIFISAGIYEVIKDKKFKGRLLSILN